MEKEWYSTCCTAPPLYDLHDNGEHELLGMCMKCQDKATFECSTTDGGELADRDGEVKMTRENHVTAQAMFADIFNRHLGIKKEKETK